MASKKVTNKKSKKMKNRIGFREIMLCSLIFSIIAFLGIACFIGEVRNNLVASQNYYYEKAQEREDMLNEINRLKKIIKQVEDEKKNNLSFSVNTQNNLNDYPIVKIKYNNKTYSIDNSAFKYSSNIHLHQSDAFLYSRNGSLTDRLNITNKLIEMGINSEQAFYFMFGNLKPRINNIFSTIEHDGVDAQVKFYPELKNKFNYISEVNKVEVDKNAFFSDFLQLLNDYSITKNKNNILNIKTIETPPENTVEVLKKNTVLRSQFQTSFAGGQSGRINNIKKALSFVNGVELKPEEVFSFNSRTAPHTLENGYYGAKVIENGKFVDGVGGGICQASTTLYNAVVLADLEVKQVQNHSLPIGYVKLPFDAMVSAGSDMVFKNNTNHSIFFKAWCDETDAHVEVYGAPFSDGITVRRKSVLKETLTDDKPNIIEDETQEYKELIEQNNGTYIFRNAVNGFIYEGYLEYVKDGQVVETKLIRTCKYYPQKAIVYVNKK